MLYRSTMNAVDQMAHATPEQAKSGVDAWMGWVHRAESARDESAVVDLGHPVGHPHYFSGPPSSADRHVTGFSILQAEDDAALRILLIGHPHLQSPGGSIEALEFLPIPGM